METVTLRYVRQQCTHPKANERNLVLRVQVERACRRVKDSRTSVNLFTHHYIRSLWVSNNRNLTPRWLEQKEGIDCKR